MSFGYADSGAGAWLTPGTLAGLWSAFLSNVVIVASTTNKFKGSDATAYPANAPFVLGVGGSTWSGTFWDYGTSCYPAGQDSNGTVIGFSEWTGFEGPSGRICDVCAPASGRYVTTDSVEQPDSSGYYSDTTGQTSGAAAQVSGTAGLMQSLAREYLGEDLSADDVVGIIEATATPWPTGGDHPAAYSVYSCPADYFGNGILNVEGAVALATDYMSCWRDQADPDLCQRVARKDGGDIIPGTWTFALVDSAVVAGVTWFQYKAQADISIPSTSICDVQPPPDRFPPSLPDRIAWVRRVSDHTKTFASYSYDLAKRVDMMTMGIHDCRLSVIDQETGTASISGHTYAYRDSVTHEVAFVVAEDDIEMAYVVMCSYPTAVSEHEGPGATSALKLGRLGCPARRPVRLSLIVHEPGAVRVGVYDVTGRCVRSLDLGRLESGTHAFTWDGLGSRGERLSAGVYWIQAALGDVARTRRLVLVE